MKRSPLPRPLRALVPVLAGLLTLGLAYLSLGPASEPPGQAAAPASRGLADGEAQILAAARARESDVWVEAGGTVERVLRDDTRGSRHQRFILRLPSGHTVLVAHNIDLAPRIEGLARGDHVDLRGEYEWNEQGGIVHWTHRDPDGRHAGGWVDYRGRRYE